MRLGQLQLATSLAMRSCMFQGIDLLSDTATRPAAAMRAAMAQAEVGDEQEGEDPTTRQLEERVAELLGHEAAMFFPSATMANEVALQLHCARGDELIAYEHSHLFFAETGGPAIHAGVMARPISTLTGIFTADDVRRVVRPYAGPHFPVTRLVAVENTTNLGGGVPWRPAQLDEIHAVADELGLKTHCDGARLMNAVVATGATPQRLAARFHSVTLCLSKGLGCPTGALLTFPRSAWERVRRLKQCMGGAMRQSGILAAAGLYALDHHVERLAEDHANARILAQGLAEVSAITVENSAPATNMVYFTVDADHMMGAEFAQRCHARGLRFCDFGPQRFRAVTHLDISRADITRALAIVQEVCAA